MDDDFWVFAYGSLIWQPGFDYVESCPATLYGWHRAMRIFDGPDEVHIRSIARSEIGREQSTFAAAVTAHD